MFDLKRRFLLPIGVVTYFSLALIANRPGPAPSWLALAPPLLAPLLLGFLLTRADRYRNAHRLVGPERPLELLLSGLVLFLTPLSLGGAGPLTRLIEAISVHAAALGALLLTTSVEAPPGFRRVPPRAQAKDIQFALSALWAPATLAALLALVAPGLVPIPPLALDTALTFSALGSLLLLLAAEGRIYFLRGLELGTLDRSKAGLALLFTSLLVALGSVLLDIGQSDKIALDCLLGGSVAVGITKIAPNPTLIARIVRGLMTLLLIGGPLSALLAWTALHSPERAVTVTLLTFAIAALLGALANAIARPFRPRAERFLSAVLRAEIASLDPDPDRAMTRVLLSLVVSEVQSNYRPEILTANPGRLLWVETGGFLREKPADFLSEVYRLASLEPFGVLRRESLEGAAVRQPEVREVLSWFLAHEAGVVVALQEEDGPVGLLVIPKGQRKSWLSFEEAEALGRLGEKLTGLVSIHSALVRSQARDLAARKLLDEERNQAAALREKFQAIKDGTKSEAERLALPLSVAGHSPRAIQTKRELEAQRDARLLLLKTPAGVDPVPWGAYLHLTGTEGPLIVFDVSPYGEGAPELAELLLTGPSSAFRRAAGGTLLVQGANLLDESLLTEIVRPAPPSLSGSAPARILLSAPDPMPLLSPTQTAPVVELPELRQRAEDLQTLIAFELARLGSLGRGRPQSLTRAALGELLDLPLYGNDVELRGTLATLVARCQGPQISREELLTALHERLSPLSSDESPEGDESSASETTARKRARSAPRARY